MEVEMTPEIINAIEEKWRGRVENLGYKKAAEVRAQADFFSGAMAALSACGFPDDQALPPRWIITVYRGDPIRELPPRE